MELNGTHGHAPPAEPRKQLLKRVQEAFAAGKTRTFRRLLESLWLWDDFGGSDLWDRVRPRSSFDPGDSTNWVPPSVPSDKRHGGNWPMWRTIQELDWLRQESRLRCASNSYAIGLLRNLVNNVINKGFAYRVRPKNPVQDDDPNTPGMQDPRDRLVAAVQDVVDDFLRRNNWNGSIDPHGNLVMAGSREREAFRRVKRDGEAFLRFHRGEKGECIVRFIEPELIRDPPGASPQSGWSYGIRHRMDPFEDVETTEAFSVFWPDPSAKGGEGEDGDDFGMGEELDAAEVLHLKGSDTDSTVKRGTPAFVYETGRALDRAAGLQRAVSLSAKVRASTAEIWQHQTATRDGISSMVGGLSEYQRTDPVTGRVRQYERIDPGNIRRIPAGQELVPNPPDQSQSYQAAGQGDLRQAAASECAPEFWMAETSSGNYSNLESAAAPAVRAGQCEQEYFKSAYARCVWKAIEWAAESGRLPENVADLVVVDVEAPAVLHRNELERAQEDTQLVQLGVKDRQTCAAERGLDWETVERNNQEYDDAHGQQGGGLGMPGEGGFPGAGGGEEEDPGGFPGEEEQAPGGEGLTEATASAALPQPYGILDGSAADETLLETFLAEAGFTGMKKDKLGRRMYYQDGKRVKAPQEAKPVPSSRVKATPKSRAKAKPKSEPEPEPEPVPEPVPQEPEAPLMPEPRAAPAPIDYAQRRPDHPVAKAIRENAVAREVLQTVLDQHAEATHLNGEIKTLTAESDRLFAAYQDPRIQGSPEAMAAGQKWLPVYNRLKEAKAHREAINVKARQALTEAMAPAQPMPLKAEIHKGQGWARAALGSAMGGPVAMLLGAFTDRVKPFVPSASEEQTIKESTDFVSSVCNWPEGRAANFTVGKSEDGRAYYNQHGVKGSKGSTVMMGMDLASSPEVNKAATIHELGHMIESTKPGVFKKVVDFWKYRTEGQKSVDIGTLPGGTGMKGERGVPDDFTKHFDDVSAAYVGKTYKFLGFTRSTEVVSMGLQALYEDPVGFMHNDPEYAAFVIGILKE